MHYLLFLTLLVALLLWALFVEYEVRKNAADIAADGAADTLGDAYHQRRTSIRAAVALALALGPDMLLIASRPARPVLTGTLVAAALMIFFPAYFAWRFNPALSVARGKPAYYVSFSPTAAVWPDRYLAAKARANRPDEGPEHQQWYAGEQLRKLLRTCLLTAAAVALLLIGAALLSY
jgi:hypothetical protein